MKNTREEKRINQIRLQDRIVATSGVNLVTCGSCGSVMLHEAKQEEIECPFCDHISEPCDFPDYFYEGFELSGEFED